MSTKQPNLFLDDEFEETKITPEKVTCLGMEFPSDEARREYFREELRKKLPELKKIEGFPIGEDDDIINLSDPPYYTACPNPWLNNFVAEWEKEKETLQNEGKRKANFEVKEPYAADVTDVKNDSVYRAHTYHTKVAHTIIMKYLLHYTQPGDIVFDGFAGTGMTGLACQSCQNTPLDTKEKVLNGIINPKDIKWGARHGICNDLSPYASIISYNYNSPIDSRLLNSEAKRIYREMNDEWGWMYKTRHTDGTLGEIKCVIWSDVVTCPDCGNEFILWKNQVDYKNHVLLDNITCEKCGNYIPVKNLEKCFSTEFDDILNTSVSCIKSIPVRIVYVANGKRFEKEVEDEDLALIEKIKNIKAEDFVPKSQLPIGYNTEQPKRTQGYYYVHQFYTRRNLLVLSSFYNKITSSVISNKLCFIFTGMINRSTKMNRVHFTKYLKGKTDWDAGHLKGTLYIPSFPVESSVLAQIENKLTRFIKAAPDLPKIFDTAMMVGTAHSIELNNNSIDYIFTDPPFGANINYSELNFLAEAWLKVETNNSSEAIINESQNKNSNYYYYEMIKCFKEFYRILKPQKWMTVEFSNTSAAVWNSIQQAITKAGFIIVNVSGLNKGQGGIRSISTTTAVRQDLAITCYKPSSELTLKFKDTISSATNSMDFIEELLVHLPVHIEKDNCTSSITERSPKILYDRLISYYVQHGYAIPMDAQEFQKELRDRFIERDGMFFTASQALEYEDKKKHTTGIVPMALFIGSEAEGIEWLKRELESPQTYSELQPEWMKAMTTTKKGDILPELMDILKENFIEDEDGKWRNPDAEKAADLEIIRNRKLMKEFNLYMEQAQKPKAKRMKDTRLEVLRYGFKECYKQKEYQTIVTVGDHIQESLLQEDEVLLQYYDIASSRV